MSRENAPIFQLNNRDLEVKKLLEVQNLLADGKYQKVIKETASARRMYPDNSSFFIVGSIALSETGKTEEAKTLLLKAEKKFPNECEVYYQLALVYEDCEEYEKAEEAYKKTYEVIPEKYSDLRSDCLNDLGTLYWSLNRKEEALEQWKLALMENPDNINAQNNYRDFTNECGEPVSVSSLMDDVHHFQNVQIDKYLKNQNIASFRSMEEAQNILDLIVNTWNNEVIPDKRKLDKLSAVEKTKWFNSIDTDFNYEEPVENYDETENEFMEIIPDELIEELDETFPYLPSGSALLLPVASVILKVIGYKEDRISEIIDGAGVSEAEEYFINWAIDIVVTIGAACDEKDSKKKTKALNDAFDIAMEELDEQDAIYVIEIIKEIFYENLGNNEEEIKKKKKTGKKKGKSKR